MPTYTPEVLAGIVQQIHAIRAELEARNPDIDLSPAAIEKALTLHARAASADLRGGGAINPSAPTKSALLLRILCGQRPLLRRPPTSYSYPCYELVENDSAVNVHIGGATTLGSMLSGTDGAKGNSSLIVNQCLYALTGMNAPAKAILSLLRDDGHFNGRRFLDLADQSPVWTLRHGQWPAWELTTGTSPDGSGMRYVVERTVPEKVQDVVYGGWGAPIDPVVVERGVDRIAAAHARKEAAKAAGPALTGLDRLLALSEDIAHPGEPEQYDWLRFTRRVWVLRKSSEWNDYEIPYLEQDA